MYDQNVRDDGGRITIPYGMVWPFVPYALSKVTGDAINRILGAGANFRSCHLTGGFSIWDFMLWRWMLSKALIVSP